MSVLLPTALTLHSSRTCTFSSEITLNTGAKWKTVKIKLKLSCSASQIKDDKTPLRLPADCWRLPARWKTGHHRRSPAESDALNSAGLWVKDRSASQSRTSPPGTEARLQLQPKRQQWDQLDAKTTTSNHSDEKFFLKVVAYCKYFY